MEKQELLERFRKLPTGNISDAMDYLKLPSGVITGLHTNSVMTETAAGFAVTVQQRDKGNNVEGKGKVQHRKVINTILGEGDMLVIDALGNMNVANGGGLLALRAKIRGASGFVVNGCLRDLNEIARREFPVYLRGASPVSSGKGMETAGINVPVTISGIRIEPGDLIAMDDSGCICIRKEDMEKVLMTAEIVHKQEVVAEELLLEGHEFEYARGEGIRRHPWPVF